MQERNLKFQAAQCRSSELCKRSARLALVSDQLVERSRNLREGLADLQHRIQKTLTRRRIQEAREIQAATHGLVVNQAE